MDWICGYCHVEGTGDDEYIRHDIRMHDGLRRTRDTHTDLCTRWGGACFCRIFDYERVDADPPTCDRCHEQRPDVTPRWTAQYRRRVPLCDRCDAILSQTAGW